jgi:hypothetical protein
MDRPKLFFLVVVLLAAWAPAADGGMTKSLFSEPDGSYGLQITQAGNNPDLFYLTFVPQQVDVAILNDLPVADTSVGWNVNFGRFAIDRNLRWTYAAGPLTVVVYDVLIIPDEDTLTVLDGLTARLTATADATYIVTGVGSFSGTMQADGGLTNVSVPDAGGSAVYGEFANYNTLTWGFAYTGFDLDDYLQNPPGYSGFAATAGFILIPEPASLGLVAIGLAALFARRRR